MNSLGVVRVACRVRAYFATGGVGECLGHRPGSHEKVLHNHFCPKNLIENIPSNIHKTFSEHDLRNNRGATKVLGCFGVLPGDVAVLVCSKGLPRAKKSP